MQQTVLSRHQGMRHSIELIETLMFSTFYLRALTLSRSLVQLRVNSQPI
jgi:hypothetical protein